MPRTAGLMDPVCGDPIQESGAMWRSDHRGETYYFCSQCCKMEFDDNPDAYGRR
jgi:YHS domain-containing protein